MTNANNNQMIQAVKMQLLDINDHSAFVRKAAMSIATDIETYIKYVNKEAASDFINSLVSWATDKKRLSEKQAYFLAKFYVEIPEQYRTVNF